MVQYWGKAVIFIKAWKCARRKLDALSDDKCSHLHAFGAQTSKPLSSLIMNPARTMLICSLTGTYALPAFRRTLRPSTSSGTVSKSTLNQPPSSISWRLRPGVAFISSAAKLLFSSSDTTSQSSCSDSTKVCLSLASSFWKRNLKSALSIRANRRRRSSVEEKARRRMKCE